MDQEYSTRLSTGLSFRFQTTAVTFPEPSLFMLVLGREGSSWDEMGMCCNNVKPENKN